ncbi:hypothetical protein HDV02_006259 [Globomyces sp. JEL0801]|nr:hypothetical protein HDV02_006259 [Globomyces sp. JEL0801]
MSMKAVGTFFDFVCIGMMVGMSILYTVSIFTLGYLLYTIFTGDSFQYSLINCLLLVEGIFLIYQELHYNYLYDYSSDHLPPMGEDLFPTLLQEVEDNNQDTQAWIEGWFFNTKFENVSKPDLYEWMGNTFFHRHIDNLTTKEFALLSDIVKILEEKHLIKFPEHNMKNQKKILLTNDAPLIINRPLLYYTSIKAFDIVCQMGFLYLGFKITDLKNGMKVYYRKGTSKLPIVFFHGLGIGVSTYVPFFQQMLQRTPDLTIVMFEMTSVSMRLDDRHILPKDYAQLVTNNLEQLEISKAIFIGHSIGTACLRWIEAYKPELIHSRIFIDPICFQLWTHDIAHNALYRTPTTNNQIIIKFIAMCEPGIAIFLHRNFVWFENTYFTSQLPTTGKSIVYLSKLDDIVNTDSVYKYLNNNNHPNRQIHMMDELCHGQMVFHSTAKLIFDDVQAMLNELE